MNLLDIILICDQMPDRTRSGPTHYNEILLDLLHSIGCRIHLVVTGPKVASLAWRKPAAAASLRYVHARAIGPILLPTSVAALLRLAKAAFVRMGLPTRLSGRAEQPIRFGRHLTDYELKRLGPILARLDCDAAFVDTIFRAASVSMLPSECARILVAHDVFSERSTAFERHGAEVANPITAGSEAAVVGQFDGILAISPKDAEALSAIAPGSPVETLLPFVEMRKLRQPTTGKSHRVFYLGTASPHNIDGLRWFLREVWPDVLKAVPEAMLDVVGDIAVALPHDAPGVVWHGSVSNLEPIACRCSFAINPLRVGSGLKMKMIDYFGLSLPVVVTSVAAAGFPTSAAPPFLSVDGNRPFADAVVKLLCDDAAVAALVANLNGYLALFSRENAATAITRLLEGARQHRLQPFKPG